MRSHDCVEVKEGGNLHIESKYQHFDSSAVDADKEVFSIVVVVVMIVDDGYEDSLSCLW